METPLVAARACSGWRFEDLLYEVLWLSLIAPCQRFGDLQMAKRTAIVVPFLITFLFFLFFFLFFQILSNQGPPNLHLDACLPIVCVSVISFWGGCHQVYYKCATCRVANGSVVKRITFSHPRGREYYSF